MKIDEEKEEKKTDYKKLADNILDASSDALGLISNPTTLWFLVLLNCSDIGAGFSSYARKPPKPTQQSQTSSSSGTSSIPFSGSILAIP